MKRQTFFLLSLTAALALFNTRAQTTFTKVTTGPIATDQGIFASAAWADFRNTGLLDLFVCNYGGTGTNGYYRNNGNGTFTKITQGDALQDTAFHIGPAVGDYDNDGYPDLFISQNGFIFRPGPGPNVLYHNNGDGTFSLAATAGITNVTGYWNAASAVDYDNDGFLDFFVPCFNGSGGMLYHNTGHGTFTRPSSAINVLYNDNDSVAWADYDNDSFMDVIIPTSSGTGGKNLFFHNNRNGNFTLISTNSVALDTWPDNPWGLAWGDYDNDGRLDLFVTGMGTTNRLYHNSGGGVFTNVTSGPMLRPPSGGGYRACAWGDYDNDGYLDLFMCGYNATNALFHNNGDGTFAQIFSGPPVQDGKDAAYCNACGWADYDNDGFLDLLVTRDSGTPTTTTNRLYHNNGNTNAWLEVKLVGAVANRSAIGAKVRVQATIGGKSFWQLREIESSGTRTIQALVAHFGLGDATNVDTLRIEWPSQTVQEFHDVAARQILNVTEPPRLLASVTNGMPQFALKAWPGMQYEVQTSPDLITWSPLGLVTITNLDGTVAIIDTNAPAVSQFYRAIQQ